MSEWSFLGELSLWKLSSNKDKLFAWNLVKLRDFPSTERCFMLPEPSVSLFQRNGWPYNFPLRPSANLSCTTQLAKTIKTIYRASESWGVRFNKTRHTDEDKNEWIPALREWGPHCRLLGHIQLPHHHMEGAHFLSFSLFSFHLSHSLLKSRLDSKQFFEVRKALSAGRCLLG